MSFSKVDEICTLFLQCNHHEQLELLNRLPNLIYRDFIGDLPLPAVTIILQNLSTPDILNCLRVCKRWNSIIAQKCSSYWRWVCLKHGLTPPFLQHHPSNIIDIGMKLQRQVWKMKQMFVDSKMSLHSPISWKSDPRSVDVSYEDCYGIRVWRSTIDSVPSSISDLQSHRVVWAAALTPTQLLFATNSAEWCKVDRVTNESLSWTDSAIVTPYQRLSACLTCGLVVAMDQQTSCRIPLTWTASFIQLIPKRSMAQRLTRYACIKRINASVNDYIPLLCVAILSRTGSQTSETRSCAMDLCIEHFLLMMIGECIFTFTYKQLHLIDVICCYTKPSGVLQMPGNSSELIRSLSSLSTKFRISQDNALIGFVSSAVLHVWDILDSSLVSRINLSVYEDCSTHYSLIAVGRLYSIVQLSKSSKGVSSVIIISTLNGELLHSVKFNEIRDFSAPLEQEWLNTIV